VAEATLTQLQSAVHCMDHDPDIAATIESLGCPHPIEAFTRPDGTPPDTRSAPQNDMPAAAAAESSGIVQTPDIEGERPDKAHEAARPRRGASAALPPPLPAQPPALPAAELTDPQIELFVVLVGDEEKNVPLWLSSLKLYESSLRVGRELPYDLFDCTACVVEIMVGAGTIRSTQSRGGTGASALEKAESHLPRLVRRNGGMEGRGPLPEAGTSASDHSTSC
jgi:hypothetical protein